jgi:putative FmdB family regulatory protein
MPVYEYRCNNCRRRVSLYVRGFSEIPEPVCTSCGGRNLTRLFSTFARVKTDKDVYEDILSDNELTQRMMANDPRAMLEWSRKMEGTEAEKSPEYEEVIERMERGEPLEKVITEMQQRELASPEAESPPGLEE